MIKFKKRLMWALRESGYKILSFGSLIDFFFIDDPLLRASIFQDSQKQEFSTLLERLITYYQLGIAYKSLGHFESALDFLFKALELSNYVDLSSTNILS